MATRPSSRCALMCFGIPLIYIALAIYCCESNLVLKRVNQISTAICNIQGAAGWCSEQLKYVI